MLIHGIPSLRGMGMRSKSNRHAIIITTEMGVHEDRAESVMPRQLVVTEEAIIAEGVAVSSRGMTTEEAKGTKSQEPPSIRTRETMIAT